MLLTATRYQARQLITQPLRTQTFKIYILQRLRKTYQHTGETPEDRFVLALVQIHWQPTDRAQPTLHQIERACQSELARFTGKNGFTVTQRILQQVVTNGFFIASQRHHISDDATRCKLKGRRARIKRQHFTRSGIEISDTTIALTHQCSQCIGG